MDRTTHYLLKNFSSLFASLFFTLFFITSIVFFIKIASITAVIKINFFELGTLYIYFLPRILIYTLPITFFIAVTVSLFNLSKENETTVLFTLGYPPHKITRFFVFISFILSIILIINFLLLIPISKQLQKNFIDYKRVEAKFNIKPTEFGQTFSNWLVYINKMDKNETYQEVVMYKPAASNKEEQNIITATTAHIQNQSGVLKLNLNDGKVFQISENKINQIVFEDMDINSFTKDHIGGISNIYDYWMEGKTDTKRASDFVYFALFALFPLATILFAISIGIVTYRYQRKSIYPSMFLVILVYMVALTLLGQVLFIYSLPIIFFTSIAVSYFMYNKKIKQRY